MKYVVGIGEALWDHFVQEDIYKLGGAPANFAYHAGQFGLDSYVISAIGDDKLGHGIVENFDKVGLKHILPIVDYPTGEVLVTKENGQPSYEICLGAAWDNIPLTDQMLELARNAKAICFGSLAQRTQTSHDTIQAFLDAAPEDALRVFDINLRQTWYTNEVIIESLNRAHILKINDDELDVVANRLLNEPVEKGNLSQGIRKRHAASVVPLSPSMTCRWSSSPAERYALMSSRQAKRVICLRPKWNWTMQ